MPRRRAKRVPKPKAHELFDLEVLERDSGSSRVKVHYTGYGSSDDEWRDEKDIVKKENVDTVPYPGSYSLYRELALR